MSASKTASSWIRPANKDEVLADGMAQNRFMVSSYTLTLNAKHNLDPVHVLQALRHLYRQVPTLRLCLQQKDGEGIWWREMQNENIDFQVRDISHVMSEHIQMAAYHFNSSVGPLWCARLIPALHQDLCPMEEIGENFPHQYYLTFGFHHCNTDGFSNAKIIGLYIQLLNSVVNGDVINDEHQLGYHDDGSQTIKMREAKKKEFRDNPELKEKKLKEFQDLKKIPYLLQSYPPEEGVIPCTLNTTYDLDKDTSKKFLARCKAEGVSVLSGFCAMANAATVEIAKENEIEEDVYHLTVYHMLNMRRYWTGDTSRALGMHPGILIQRAPTPNNVKHDIWSHARSFHKVFQTSLKSGQTFEDNAISSIDNDSNRPEGENPFESIPMASKEYITNNMGNLDRIIPGEMPHVQMTHIMRTTSNHPFGNAITHVIQSFRGRFLYGCNYCPNKVSTQTAKYYVNKIFNILKKYT